MRFHVAARIITAALTSITLAASGQRTVVKPWQQETGPRDKEFGVSSEQPDFGSDNQIFDIVTADLRARLSKDHWGKPYGPLLVNQDTAIVQKIEQTFVTSKQARADSSTEQAQSSWIARNSVVQRLPKHKSPSLVQSVNLDEKPKGWNRWDDIEVRFPASVGYCYWRLPGYSQDKTLAFVNIPFGPSSHGAVAVYVLERTKKGWRIKKADLKYFV